MADFTLDISYNKKLEVKDGVCSLAYTTKSGLDTHKWVLERQLVEEMIALRPALEKTFEQSTSCSFGLRKTHSIRTAYMIFDGEKKFMIIFSFKKDDALARPQQQVIMTVPKFNVMMEGLSCYVEGRVPVNVDSIKAEESGDFSADLEEVYRLVLNSLFSLHVGKALESMCYGCTGTSRPRPSQKDHDFCLQGTDMEAASTIFSKFVTKELFISVSIMAFQFWIEQNKGLSISYSVESIVSYLCKKSSLPFNFTAVESVRADVEKGLTDPSKNKAVKCAVDYLYSD